MRVQGHTVSMLMRAASPHGVMAAWHCSAWAPMQRRTCASCKHHMHQQSLWILLTFSKMLAAVEAYVHHNVLLAQRALQPVTVGVHV